MIFTARAEWEIKDPLLKALGEDESVRSYPFIEIHLNVPLFHVDVRIPYDEDQEISGWRRFMMHDIEHVNQLVKQNGVIEYDIYLETPRDMDKKSVERHKVKRLGKVIQGEDAYGCKVEAYIFTDGDYYIFGEIESVEDIKNTRVVFERLPFCS